MLTICRLVAGLLILGLCGTASAQQDCSDPFSSEQNLRECLSSRLPARAPALPGQEIARVIATACPNLAFVVMPPPGTPQGQLLEDCSAVVGPLFGNDPVAMAQVSEALAQIAPDQASAAADAAQNGLGGQSSAVQARVAAVRAGGSPQQLSFSGPLGAYGGMTLMAQDDGVMGSAGLVGSRWGFFATGSIRTGDKSGTRLEEGFDFDEQALLLGVDYRLTRDFILGAGVSLTRTDTDLDANGGDIDARDLSFIGYFAYAGESPWFFQLDGSVGRVDYEAERFITYTLPTAQVAQSYRSAFEGDKTAFAGSLGYDIVRGSHRFSPQLRLSWLDLDLDGYSEVASNPGTAGAGWAIGLDGQSYRSFTGQLGVQWSNAVSQSWGVLLPFAEVSLVHEFEDDQRIVSGRLLADPTATTFFLPTDSADSNYQLLGLGVSAVWPQGWSGFLSYSGVFGYDDVSHHGLSAGFRREF